MYNREGMAQYMYKNIRRKQKAINELFTYNERTKDQNYETYLRRKNLFFSPYFLQSCIRFD